MRKIVSIFLLFIFNVFLIQAAFAQPQSNWEAVKAAIDQEIAIKIKNKKIIFGILRSANDEEVKIQIASTKLLTSDEIIVKRVEVEKLWKAKLHFNLDSVGEAALRAGVYSSAVGLIGAAIHNGIAKEESSATYGKYMGVAAGIGILLAVLSRKKHRKGELIYSL